MSSFRQGPGRNERRATFFILLGSCLVFIATGVLYLHNARSYIDNGDGYYLYAAQRVAHGARLYREVMGTQPPVVYLFGALLFKLGATLPAMRLASVAMRGAAMLLLFFFVKRLWGDLLVAGLATLLYALSPIGLLWDRSFDVNNPLVLVSLLSVMLLARPGVGAARWSGLAAALAIFTKDLYLPLLATMVLWLLSEERRSLVPFLQGLVGGVLAGCAALTFYGGVGALHDAFLGQGSSPLSTASFFASMLYIVELEAGLVLVGCVGLSRLWRARDLSSRRATTYMAAVFCGSAAVLLATLKAGTFGTVFVLAEPAIAALAAFASVGVLRDLRAGSLRPARALLLPGLVLAWLLYSVPIAVRGLQVDNAATVDRLVRIVRARAEPGARIVAPPYYAFLSSTVLPADAADTYIVAERVARGDPTMRAWADQVARALQRGEIPAVLLDLRLAAIGPLQGPLHARYRRLYSDPLPSSLHVDVWVPRVQPSPSVTRTKEG